MEILKFFASAPVLVAFAFTVVTAIALVVSLVIAIPKHLFGHIEWDEDSKKSVMSVSSYSYLFIFGTCLTYYYGVFQDSWGINHMRFPSTWNWTLAYVFGLFAAYCGFRTLKLALMLHDEKPVSRSPVESHSQKASSTVSADHPFGKMSARFVDVPKKPTRMVTKTVTCPDCGGSGMANEQYEHWYHSVACVRCGGSVKPSRHVMGGYYSKEKHVPGSGRIQTEVEVECWTSKTLTARQNNAPQKKIPQYGGFFTSYRERSEARPT